MLPKETFLGQAAFHSTAVASKHGDEDVPESMTDYSQVVASELLSPEQADL